MQNPDHGHRTAGIDAMPVRLAAVVAGHQTGLRLEFAHHTAGYIKRAIPDIVEIGRAGWKIDASSIGGVASHLTEHEGAIGAAQRAHPETVKHAIIRKTPVAPRQEAGEISLEIRCGKA